MRVLLAEDDDLTRQGLAEVLQEEGYDVVQAANGSAALDCFTAQRPDFVCLDIMMPGRNGYDVCRAIRDADPDIPIIFISAKSEEIDKVVGFEIGADDFIVKPFGVREVVARGRHSPPRPELAQVLGEELRVDALRVVEVDRRAGLDAQPRQVPVVVVLISPFLISSVSIISFAISMVVVFFMVSSTLSVPGRMFIIFLEHSLSSV